MEITSFDKTMYVSHPYGGVESNKRRVEDIISKMEQVCPECLFVSPIHSFSWEYDKIPYEKGLEQCLWLEKQCDEILMCGEWWMSKGCLTEIEFAIRNGIPVRLLSEMREYDRIKSQPYVCEIG